MPRLAFLLSLSICLPATAQDIQGNVAPAGPDIVGPSQEDQGFPVRELTPPAVQFPLCENLLFVVDVSGSMQSEGRIGKALFVTMFLMQQGIDDYCISVMSFNVTVQRWPGIEEEGVPEGWAAMPNQDDAFVQADEWLKECGVGDYTDPGIALRAAFREDVEPLSIILITDGNFNRGDPVMRVLMEEQAARRERGQTDAILMVFGVGVTTTNQERILRALGVEGGGGAYVYEGE